MGDYSIDRAGVLAIFEKRRSIRRFKIDDIDDRLLEQIIYAGSLAPTARNVQPWHFIIIKDADTRLEIARLAVDNAPFLKECPVCIAVVCQDTKYYLEDGSAATTQILLCAAGFGIGGCWVAADKKEYCSTAEEILKIPRQMKLFSLVALGYPKEIPKVSKKPIAELIHKEKF